MTEKLKIKIALTPTPLPQGEGNCSCLCCGGRLRRKCYFQEVEKSSLSDDPLHGGAPGEGAVSLGYFSLGKQRKVTPRRQAVDRLQAKSKNPFNGKNSTKRIHLILVVSYSPT
jgi:hypothetical protein